MRRLWWIGLVALAACGGDGGAKAKKRPDKDNEKEERKPKVFHGEVPASVTTSLKAPEVVVLIVTDTVRADHLSLCGYHRPTSPFLEQLVKSHGAVHSCRAYSPGTWTLPSHASYFTGLHSTEHHVLNKGLALDAQHETLAEVFGANGYQTVLVSANPTLNQPSGVWQGFEHIRVARGLYAAWRGGDLGDEVQKALAQVDPSKPLFLMVNIFDAHDPYPAIPGDVKWLPKRPRCDLNPDKEAKDGPIQRFVAGTLTGADRESFLSHIVDTYDYGISRADRNVERVADLLKGGGWLRRGWRMVVTSDHGEHLGEHEMIRHDGPPWEGVARVPVLYVDSERGRPALPEVLSATGVFWLTKDGALPEKPPRPASASITYVNEQHPMRDDAVAWWASPTDKRMWIEGQSARYDLGADPRELSPQAVPADDTVLLPAAEALKVSKQIAEGKGQDPEMMKMLEAVGYVD